MSRQHRPTQVVGRTLARLSRWPVTRIPQWDNPDFGNWPKVPIKAARSRVTRDVEAHVTAHSVDEAHADIVDRIVNAITNTWRMDLYQVYVDRHQALEEAQMQGRQHLAALELRVRRDERRRATAAAVRDSAQRDLIGEELPPADDLNTRTTDLTLDPAPHSGSVPALLAPPLTAHTSRLLPPAVASGSPIRDLAV